METATLFRAYQKATVAATALHDRYEIRAQLGRDNPITVQIFRQYQRRLRQRDKFAARIAIELVADGWTYIDPDNSATLPPGNQTVCAAWTNGTESYITKSRHLYRRHYNNGAFRFYAWRPWPAPPPLPEVTK